MLGADRAQEIEAGQARHAQVGEHDVDWLLLQECQRFLAGGGDDHVDFLAREDLGERFGDAGFVVDDEQGGHCSDHTRLHGARPTRDEKMTTEPLFISARMRL